MALTTTQTGAIVAGCAGAIIGIICITMIVTRDRNCFTFPRRHPPVPPTDIESQVPSSEVEKYGELYVPPDRRPTVVGLDIINRTLAGMCIPSKAVPASPFTAARMMEMGHIPRLSLDFERPSYVKPEEQVRELMEEVKPKLTEKETSTAALESEESLIRSMQAALNYVKQDRELVESSRQGLATEKAATRVQAGQGVDVAHEEVITGKFVDVELTENRIQEIFVVGEEKDDGKQVEHNDGLAVDPMSYTYGSGKAMADLYR